MAEPRRIECGQDQPSVFVIVDPATGIPDAVIVALARLLLVTEEHETEAVEIGLNQLLNSTKTNGITEATL